MINGYVHYQGHDTAGAEAAMDKFNDWIMDAVYADEVIDNDLNVTIAITVNGRTRLIDLGFNAPVANGLMDLAEHLKSEL